MHQVTANTDKPARPLSILLVEDSPSVQEMAALTLRFLGHQVTAVRNGLQAVQVFEEAGRRGVGSLFDVVLMDLSMPEMDGLTAARLIREEEAASGRRVRIVALTAFATPEYRAKCRAIGMDAFVAKPINMDELSEAMMPSRADPDVQPILEASPSTKGEPFDPPGDRPSVSGPVDLRTALEAVGGDVDILAAAVAMALEEIPQQMAKLKAAMSRGETQAVAAEAHRLKGIMANLGGTHARERARRLEALDGLDLRRSGPELLIDLEREVGRVMDFYADAAWMRHARESQEGSDG